MNNDQFEGQWHQFKGKLREKWGELTDDDIDRIAGRREQLAGEIQSRYGKSKEEAKREVDDFIDSL